MKRCVLWIAMVLVPVAGTIVLLLPVGGINDVRMSVIEHPVRAKALDLSGYPDGAPERPVHLLFMHHSCGGELLAAPGPAEGANSITTLFSRPPVRPWAFSSALTEKQFLWQYRFLLIHSKLCKL